MSKKRKKSPVAQVNGYKKFLADVSATLDKFDIKGTFQQMSVHFKRMMWDYKMVIRNPVAANNNVSTKELKSIAQQTKKYFHLPTQKIWDKKISAYELQLINCYCQIRVKELTKQHVDEDHPEITKMVELSDHSFTTFLNKYFLDYFRIIIRLNNPDKKYYGVSLRIAHIFKDNPTFEIETQIHGFNAIKHIMDVNGQKRPAFRLAKTDAKKPITWITINSGLVKDFYKGDKTELDIYIQSHALSRLRERLDLLSHEGTNYVLWENTAEIKEFISYKNYLYLPLKLYGVKVGYLLANIIDEKLLFRTFLFVTHNSTPEGDKLKQITGLGKHDISYWHIDRLSTFVNLDEKKYPGLSKLFGEAGLGELSQLKDKEFDIEAIQNANLDGLATYIKQGQQFRSV